MKKFFKPLMALVSAIAILATVPSMAYAAEAPRLIKDYGVLDDDWLGTEIAKGYFSKANKPLKETTKKGNVKFVAELNYVPEEGEDELRVSKKTLFGLSMVDARFVAAGKNEAKQFMATKWTDSINLVGSVFDGFNPSTDALYLHVSYVKTNGKTRTYDVKLDAIPHSIVQVDIATGLKKATKRFSYAVVDSDERIPVCHNDLNFETVFNKIERAKAGSKITLQVKAVRQTATKRTLCKTQPITFSADMIAGIHNGRDVVTPFPTL